MTNAGSIAVLIPAYNAQSTIKDCLHSVQVQTHPCFVVVIDDCSTDRTAELASQADLLIHNETRKGKARSLNDALRLIQQDYVLVLDSDTYLERKFIEKLVNVLRGHNYDCGSGYAKYIGRSSFAKAVAKNWSVPEKDTWRFNGCCQFFKTELIRKEKFSEDCLVEDEEIFWRLNKKKTCLVNAIAHSEASRSPKEWFAQHIRWQRGAFQLTRSNLWHVTQHKYRIDMMSYFFLPLLSLILFGFGTFSTIESIKQSNYLGAIALPVILLVFGIYSCPSRSLICILPHSLFVRLILPIYLFFEVLLFNRKMPSNTYWGK